MSVFEVVTIEEVEKDLAVTRIALKKARKNIFAFLRRKRLKEQEATYERIIAELERTRREKEIRS
ncbi:hypothetical protein J6X90_03700 [Candidatus Saccharibacteria bacterium]|nr:hypothetical protein [Candidatus Saccharibacteria bacterium]